jgi:hypothetical protein
VLSKHCYPSEVPHLEVLADKVDQIVMATTRSDIGQSKDGILDVDSDPDSFSTDDDITDILEDLKAYMECLVDLAPSLEHPAEDLVLTERPSVIHTDDLLNVTEAARPYVLLIKDRYPLIENSLIKRLGEANWQRRERLREQLSSALLADGRDPRPFSDTESGKGKAVDNSTQAEHLEHRSIPSIYESTIHPSNSTISALSDSSIFDYMPLRFNVSRARSVAESVTSFSSSTAGGAHEGQRRVPSLPEDHDWGASFQCQICGNTLQNIRCRSDWK